MPSVQVPTRWGACCILWIGVAAALSGCGESRAREHVAGRLDAASFDDTPVSLHGAVAQIGTEARPVLRETTSRRVAAAYRLELTDRGVRAEVDLPDEFQQLPAGAFALGVQPFSGAAQVLFRARGGRERATAGPGEEALEKEAFRLYTKPAHPDEWRLEPLGGGRAAIVYEPAKRPSARHCNLLLDLVEPGPSELRSRSFGVPAGADLELSYGLTASGGREAAPVRFDAELVCNEGASRPVVADRVDPASADEPTWHGVRVTPAPDERTCRLVLAARSETGAPARGRRAARACRVTGARPPSTGASGTA